MARTSLLYVAVMIGAGLVLGSLDGARYVFLLPPLFGLLAISLAFDLIVVLFGAWLRLPALPMPARITGFLSGAILYFLISWILGNADLSA